VSLGGGSRWRGGTTFSLADDGIDEVTEASMR
jgi:hypothetical protein